MKKLQKLNKAEMKNVMGGVVKPNFSCQCTGSVGTWTTYYSSTTAMINDIQATCSSGQGTCTAIGS